MGNNLPDLDVLIEISDYYEVDLREILNGERKSEKMDKDLEETVLQSVDYTNMQTEKYVRKVKILFLIGAILLFVAQTITHTSLDENIVMSNIADFASGATFGMLFGGLLASSKYGQRLKEFKHRLLKKA